MRMMLTMVMMMMTMVVGVAVVVVMMIMTVMMQCHAYKPWHLPGSMDSLWLAAISFGSTGQHLQARFLPRSLANLYKVLCLTAWTPAISNLGQKSLAARGMRLGTANACLQMCWH